MVKKYEQYSDQLARLYPELLGRTKDRAKKISRTVTFQVTDDCNLRCTYCYQINKGKRRMKFETAKKMIDDLLNDKTEYCNRHISPGIIIEFIGGEPFMEVELMDEITEYFKMKAIEMMHPWAEKYMISISSNGTLYFEPEVQKYMQKNRNHLSISITIDGNKELHDKCRVFPDGSGSYDLAYAAAMDWIAKGGYMGSKITICPENLEYLNEAISHFIDTGYDTIFANTVYEEGWTKEDATKLYWQMKELADFLLDGHTDIYISLFDENAFTPMPEYDNENWCWGAGTPILTTEGYKPIESIKVGDEVYTEDGTIHPVIRTTSHMADNAVNIKMSGVYDLVCTADHKLFAKPFDYLGWKGKKHYREYGKHEVKDIKHKDLVKLFQLPNGAVKYNPDVAYVVGRYIGDGWKSTTGFKICCAFDEEQELKDKLDQANVSYSTTKYPTVIQFNILKANRELLDILESCGSGSANKHIPPECFLWDTESLAALLDGYMDSDGNVNKRGQSRFNTVSYQLAQEMMVILRTLGYTPTCHHNKRGGKSTILGRPVNIKDRYEVYFYEDKARSKYVHSDDDGMWSYGLKVKNAEPQVVYNITVDENHSYVAGGIVSANCGGTGTMLSMDPDGYYYPCIRYMESSLGDDRPPIKIGHCDTGIACTEEDKETVRCLDCITRRSQSTDECFYCPIARGCAWCSAYNYQKTGSVDHRVTYICDMHKARSLANVYYWNKQGKHLDLNCPEEWALEIIPKEEYLMLKELAERK